MNSFHPALLSISIFTASIQGDLLMTVIFLLICCLIYCCIETISNDSPLHSVEVTTNIFFWEKGPSYRIIKVRKELPLTSYKCNNFFLPSIVLPLIHLKILILTMLIFRRVSELANNMTHKACWLCSHLRKVCFLLHGHLTSHSKLLLSHFAFILSLISIMMNAWS